MYAPLVRGEADAVFGSRMMKDFGGPLKGGMPLYKSARQPRCSRHSRIARWACT